MESFKAQLRIPTEQYAYIEVSVEGTAEHILEVNRQFTELVKPKTGISERDFNAFLDNMARKGDGSNHVEVYQAMNDRQKDIVQALKRLFKRLEPKQ